jgi:hypothetical protein
MSPSIHAVNGDGLVGFGGHLMALTALQVKNAKPGDKLTDGGGLRLDVDKIKAGFSASLRRLLAARVSWA